MSRSQQLLSTYAPWLAGAVFLFAGLYCCLADKVSAGSVLLTFGLLLWLLANLEKLESFKGFGVEATMRRLEGATDDARSVLADLEGVKASLAILAEGMEAQRVAAIAARDDLDMTLSALKQELDSTRGLATIAFLDAGVR